MRIASTRQFGRGKRVVLAQLLHHRYDVRDSFATGDGAEETNSVVCIPFDLLTKTYYSVDRIFLWTVLARFDVPPNNLISIVHQFHNGIRAFVWLDDGMSGLFAVGQGLREGWVLAPFLFDILFVAVIYVA